MCSIFFVNKLYIKEKMEKSLEWKNTRSVMEKMHVGMF